MAHTRAIMAIHSRHLGSLALPLVLCGGSMAIAQEGGSDPALKLIKGGGTPAVFDGRNQQPPPSSCPAIVNPTAGGIQPLRIAPTTVAAKNKLGCLSPNDAIYGADGCPLRLCGERKGTVPLPADRAIPQLPEP